MRVRIDEAKCVGSGMCLAAVPQVFDLDDDLGKAILLTTEVPAELEHAVEDAEACCPVGAIEVLR